MVIVVKNTKGIAPIERSLDLRVVLVGIRNVKALHGAASEFVMVGIKNKNVEVLMVK